MENLSNKKLKSLPFTSGVYLFMDGEGKVIYIGKSVNLHRRILSYFSRNNSRYSILSEKIRDIDYIVTTSEMEALVLETNLIKEYQPRYNVRLKDDKRYPYLVFTKENFPQILITRNPLSPRTTPCPPDIYGPYTDVKSLRRIVKMLREVFCLRTCSYDLNKKRLQRPCLYYDLKCCSAPCRGYISIIDYNKMVRGAKLFLEGRNRILQREAKREMGYASSLEEYEKAGRWRDMLKAIEKILETQAVFSKEAEEGDFWAMADKGENACLNLFKVREGRVIARELFILKGSPVFSGSETMEEFLGQYYSTQTSIPSHIYTNISVGRDNILKRYLIAKGGRRIHISSPREGQKRNLLELGFKNASLRLKEESLKTAPQEMIDNVTGELKKILNLPHLPYRVEGIDISHLHGDEAAGVVTVFENGKPKPSDYRRFRIKFSPTHDDCQMVAEIVERRYRRILEMQIIRPDIVLVDGGKGQVMAAFKKLKELGFSDIAVIGIAKRFEHIYTPGHYGPIVIPPASSLLNFFKAIRDEAHRFTQRYHHCLRTKKIFL